MTKDELKVIMESHKFEQQYYIEKSQELDKIKNSYVQAIDRLKAISQGQNEHLVEAAIKTYTLDMLAKEEELDKLNSKRNFVSSLIELVDQPYRNVLYFKYICCKSVEEIAMRMNYSTQRIYQLHDIGMNQVLEKQKEDAE